MILGTPITATFVSVVGGVRSFDSGCPDAIDRAACKTSANSAVLAEFSTPGLLNAEF